MKNKDDLTLSLKYYKKCFEQSGGSEMTLKLVVIAIFCVLAMALMWSGGMAYQGTKNRLRLKKYHLLTDIGLHVMVSTILLSAAVATAINLGS